MFIQSTLSKTYNFGTGTMWPSWKESNKRRKESQEPTLGVLLIETIEMSVLQTCQCPSY